MVVKPNLKLAAMENTSSSVHRLRVPITSLPAEKEKTSSFSFPKQVFLSLLQDMVG